MITASSITGGDNYLSKHLRANDYYEEGKEVSGEWIGNGAQKLGLESVPVDVQKFETEEAELAHLLADNRIAELAEQGDPRMFGNGEVFDKYPCAKPKVANFYERYMAGERMPTFWVNDSDYETWPLE